MVKHIVVWKLRDSALGNDRQVNAVLVSEKLMALRGKIEGIIALEVGVDFSRTDTSGDLVLYSEFTDRQALSRYQMHPEHEALKPFISEVTSERRVVDYEM